MNTVRDLYIYTFPLRHKSPFEYQMHCIYKDNIQESCKNHLLRRKKN